MKAIFVISLIIAVVAAGNWNTNDRNNRQLSDRDGKHQMFIIDLLRHLQQDNNQQEFMKYTYTIRLDNQNDYNDLNKVYNLVTLYRNGLFVERGKPFSLFRDRNIITTKALFDFFDTMKDWNTVAMNLIWARCNINEYQFWHLITLLCTHNRHLNNIVLPAAYEVFPTNFFTADVIDEATDRMLTLNMNHFKVKQIVMANYTTGVLGSNDNDDNDNVYDLNNIKNGKNVINNWQTLRNVMYDIKKQQQMLNMNNNHNGVMKHGKNKDMVNTVYNNNRNLNQGNKFDNNGEDRMVYFTEDVGLNNFYYYQRIGNSRIVDNNQMYNNENNKATFNKINKKTVNHNELDNKINRRGERYLYQLKQLLARFNLERQCNGLDNVQDISLDGVVENGAYPNIRYTNGLQMPNRHNDHHLKTQQTVKLIQFTNDFENRFIRAIDQGYVETVNGNKVFLNNHNGINILGNLLQGNRNSINTQYYRHLETYYRMLLGGNFNDNVDVNDNRFVPTALENYETSMRDPVFWQMLKRITIIVNKYKNKLVGYKTKDLDFYGVKINNVKVDKLVTKFDYFDCDISNGINMNINEYNNCHNQKCNNNDDNNDSGNDSGSDESNSNEYNMNYKNDNRNNKNHMNMNKWNKNMDHMDNKWNNMNNKNRKNMYNKNYDNNDSGSDESNSNEYNMNYKNDNRNNMNYMYKNKWNKNMNNMDDLNMNDRNNMMNGLKNNKYGYKNNKYGLNKNNGGDSNESNDSNDSDNSGRINEMNINGLNYGNKWDNKNMNKNMNNKYNNYRTNYRNKNLNNLNYNNDNNDSNESNNSNGDNTDQFNRFNKQGTSQQVDYWKRIGAVHGGTNLNSWKHTILGRQRRLTTQKFTVTIDCLSNKNTNGIVRIFMGKRINNKQQLNDNRNSFVEIDQFIVNLKQGQNVINRHSIDFKNVVADPETMSTLYFRTLNFLNQKTKGNDLNNLNFDTNNNNHGFPHRLLLPKGTVGGEDYTLFVVVSDLNNNNYNNAQFNVDNMKANGLTNNKNNNNMNNNDNNSNESNDSNNSNDSNDSNDSNNSPNNLYNNNRNENKYMNNKYMNNKYMNNKYMNKKLDNKYNNVNDLNINRHGNNLENNLQGNWGNNNGVAIHNYNNGNKNIGNGNGILDNRALGFPLDRIIVDVDGFVTNNMFFKDVTVYHIDNSNNN